MPGRREPDAGRLPCRVWLADPAALRPAHLALLDATERERFGRYRRAEDGARFAVAAALLRLVVGAQTATAPAAVRVDRTCGRCPAPHGRPRAPGTDLHVSISHSDALVALAVTAAAPVGVDVEAVVERDVAGLARPVLAPSEVMGRPADFYTYWCRKEAVVKATGDGLGVPLCEVVVSRADEPARLLSYPGTPLGAALSDLPVGPGFAGAVAVLADGELEVELRDATALLAVTGH